MALPEPVRRHAFSALAAALLLAILFGNRGFRRLVTNVFELRRLTAELALLQREEAELKERVSLTSGDERVLERAARAELGYLRPGELEYRFPPPAKEGT